MKPSLTTLRPESDLSREIERNGFEVSRLITEKSVNNILRRNNFQTLDDMYAGIGYGSVSVVKGVRKTQG